MEHDIDNNNASALSKLKARDKGSLKNSKVTAIITKKAGRPIKAQEEKRDKQLSIYLNKSELDFLQNKSDEEFGGILSPAKVLMILINRSELLKK